MSKSIEERMIESHNEDRQKLVLREIFDVYNDPRNEVFGLLHTLGSVQKQFGTEWKEHVIACMYGMEIHDAGQFPDDLLAELEDESFEAYSNASMGSTPRQP